VTLRNIKPDTGSPQQCPTTRHSSLWPFMQSPFVAHDDWYEGGGYFFGLPRVTVSAPWPLIPKKRSLLQNSEK
jgi:hypothetical protein